MRVRANDLDVTAALVRTVCCVGRVLKLIPRSAELASTTEIFISRQRSFNASVYLSFETCSGKTDISDSMLVPCDASSDSGQPPHFGHDKNTDTGTGSTRAVWRRRRLSGEILTRAASRAVCEAATSKFPPPRAGAPAKSRFCSATISRRAALRRAKRPAGETS